MADTKQTNTINVALLKQMLISGGEELAKHYQHIDELNVFPVPDGDTGTNMKITLEGAISAVKSVDYTDLFTLGKQWSRGLLMNARGNSGVITSQIFKGFFSNFKEGQTEVSVDELVAAFASARNVAYAAVSNPVEGTILTVIRVTSEKLDEEKANFKTIDEVFERAIAVAEETLAKTPDMLHELKEVGVVDSGGYGLCKILRGMNDALDVKIGKKVSTEVNEDIQTKKSFVPSFSDDNEGFGYCNEFIMTIGSKVELKQKDKEKFVLEEFKHMLEKMGNSLVVVVDDNIVKVHIHAVKPWKIFDYASKFGEFNKVKVENMTLQFLERNPGTTLEALHNEKTHKGFVDLTIDPKIVATVPSAQYVDIYKENFNIQNTINTENTGNPSVQDFLEAIKKTKSSRVLLIVDDSNYILAAKETLELLPNNVKVELFAAGNIANSYIACLAFNDRDTYSENTRAVGKKVKSAKVCRVSKAVKDVKYSHISVKKNDYIGIIDKKIITSGKNLLDVTESLIKTFVRKGKYKHSFIFYGDNTTINDAETLKKSLKQTYLINSDIIDGGQKNYFFTIAFEV